MLRVDEYHIERESHEAGVNRPAWSQKQASSVARVGPSHVPTEAFMESECHCQVGKQYTFTVQD